MVANIFDGIKSLFFKEGKPMKIQVVTELKLPEGGATLAEIAAALSTPGFKEIPKIVIPKPKGLYSADSVPDLEPRLMTREEHEEHRKQGRMTGKLEADSLTGEEYLRNRNKKLYADGQEYTLYTDGGPYLKQIEVNDPETFELTYDRVLDEVLSNPSATGLKVEVTKDKFVATIEYKKEDQ